MSKNLESQGIRNKRSESDLKEQQMISRLRERKPSHTGRRQTYQIQRIVRTADTTVPICSFLLQMDRRRRQACINPRPFARPAKATNATIMDTIIYFQYSTMNPHTRCFASLFKHSNLLLIFHTLIISQTSYRTAANVLTAPEHQLQRCVCVSFNIR